MAEEREFRCPNCNTPAKGTPGQKVYCASCGGVFRYDAGEAKLDKTVDFDKLQADVEELKARLPASRPAADPCELSDDDDVDDDDDDDEEEDL
jgi:hypothetical protein